MRDSGQPDWKCGEVAGEFELKGNYLHGPISALSGGWQTRVKLAALLLHDPNLLLLDEPTNFLDLRTQILLEHFLRGFSKAALIVSHDRAFLRATCDQTLDLSRGKQTMYPGKIDDFLDYQAERRLHDQRVNATVQAKQKQLQRFIDKNRARASTATQAKSKGKQLERLQTIEIASDEPTAHIRAPIVAPRQGPAVRCLELAIGYAPHIVAKEISLEVEHGQRVAIVGDNGQGKTTLLRTLVGSLEPMAGQVKWGYGCEIGTYAQHVYTAHDPKKNCSRILGVSSDPGNDPADDSRRGRRASVPRFPYTQEKSRSSLAANALDCAWPDCSLEPTTYLSWTNRETIWMSRRSRPWPRLCRNTRELLSSPATTAIF